MGVFFFFSSRRRHTRSLRDWSSDVCSSDLHALPRPLQLSGTITYSKSGLFQTWYSLCSIQGKKGIVKQGGQTMKALIITLNSLLLVAGMIIAPSQAGPPSSGEMMFALAMGGTVEKVD